MWKAVWMTTQGLLLHLRDTSQRCFPGGGGTKSSKTGNIGMVTPISRKKYLFLSIPYSSRKDDSSKKSLFFASSLKLKCKEIRKAWINIHQRFNTSADLSFSAILRKKNRLDFRQRHVWTFSNPIPGSRAAESFSPFLLLLLLPSCKLQGRKRICCVKEKRKRRRRKRPVRAHTWGDASNHCAFAAAAAWGENFFSFSSAGLGR